MKSTYQITSIISLCFLLSSCFSAPVKNDDLSEETSENVEVLAKNSHNIDHIEPVSFVVSSIKSWQNTKIFIQNGDVVTIKAHGRWSPWPAMGLWSGPEGSVFWGREESAANGSALIARLGYKGGAISVGPKQTFKAKDYGMLYLAMNDSFEFLFDNEGEMDAEIFVDRNKQLSSSTSTTGSYQITSYSYDDKKQTGSISATANADSFAVRKWLLVKIGEIASSKNVSIDARKNAPEGGSYRVMDENINNGVLTIDFETVW